MVADERHEKGHHETADKDSTHLFLLSGSIALSHSFSKASFKKAEFAVYRKHRQEPVFRIIDQGLNF